MPGTGSVERVDLAPLPPVEGAGPAPDQPPQPDSDRTAGLPPGRPETANLWRGVDVAALEELLVPLDVPPRSPALHALWLRLLADSAPTGRLAAIQAEALWRSGLLGNMSDRLGATGDGDAVAAVLALRRTLASADPRRACANPATLQPTDTQLPKQLKAELAVLAGYCAIAVGNPSAAGLAANLAREEEASEVSIALLEAHAVAGSGGRPAGARIPVPKRLSVLDHRLAEPLGVFDPAAILERAEPALLAALAVPATKDLRLRFAAMERAVAVNALTPAVWRTAARALSEAAAGDPQLRRAALLRAIGLEQTPVRRARGVRALLDEARRSGLYLHAARAAAGSLDEIQSAADLGPLAETAIELALAAGDFSRARQLAGQSPRLGHWMLLADILDPAAGRRIETGLGHVEEMARHGRFPAEVLHRLAATLDALDVQIPIPLWEAASRTQQPGSGHLPETGILPRLQDAARKGEIARTILLVLRTLGPGGADAAHLIALGDSLRALRRIGFEAEARQLAFEALFASWPRGTSG